VIFKILRFERLKQKRRWINSRTNEAEEIVWLTAQPRLHSFHDLFVDVEPLASQVLLKWSKQMKITGKHMDCKKGEVASPVFVH
jgi:hypothetical protein